MKNSNQSHANSRAFSERLFLKAKTKSQRTIDSEDREAWRQKIKQDTQKYLAEGKRINTVTGPEFKPPRLYYVAN